MVHTEVVDGGDGFQIWKVPTNVLNVLNKLLWTAVKGCSSSFGVECGELLLFTIKKYACYEISQRALD
jgi:hypothetical protein